MDLYHYTSVSQAESISLGFMFKGAVPVRNGYLTRTANWLTSSPTPQGHGLPTAKRALTDTQKAQALMLGDDVKGKLEYNKTEIRYRIDASKLEHWLKEQRQRSTNHAGYEYQLLSFEEWAKRSGQPQGFAKLIGLSAVVELDELSKAQFNEAMRSKGNTWEHTWLLCFANIPVTLFDTIEFNQEGNFVPYEFEAHGRSSFATYGNVAAGAEALAELRSFFQPSHKFDNPKAFAWCSDPAMSPAVTFRGAGGQWAHRLNDPLHIDSSLGYLPKDLSPFVAWVTKHRSELLAAWNQAVQVYYDFNPDNPRPV